MKSLWQNRSVFGALDWIDLTIFVALFIFNTIELYISGRGLFSLYNMLFLIAIILIHTMPFRNYIKSFIFLALAIITHYDSPSPSDFSSAMFFLFAFSEVKNVKIAVIVCVASLSVIVYKSSIVGDSNPQALSMAVLFAYLYIRSYYSLFRKPIPKKIHRNIDDLEPLEKAVMNYISIDGFAQKRIAVELNNPESQFYNPEKQYTGDMVYRIIKKVRDDLTPDGSIPLVTEQVIRLLALESENTKRKTDTEKQ